MAVLAARTGNQSEKIKTCLRENTIILATPSKKEKLAVSIGCSRWWFPKPIYISVIEKWLIFGTNWSLCDLLWDLLGKLSGHSWGFLFDSHLCDMDHLWSKALSVILLVLLLVHILGSVGFGPTCGIGFMCLVLIILWTYMHISNLSWGYLLLLLLKGLLY